MGKCHLKENKVENVVNTTKKTLKTTFSDCVHHLWWVSFWRAQFDSTAGGQLMIVTLFLPLRKQGINFGILNLGLLHLLHFEMLM